MARIVVDEQRQRFRPTCAVVVMTAAIVYYIHLRDDRAQPSQNGPEDGGRSVTYGWDRMAKHSLS